MPFSSAPRRSPALIRTTKLSVAVAATAMIKPPSATLEPPLQRHDHQPLTGNEDQHNGEADGKEGRAVGRSLSTQHQIADPGWRAQQLRDQGNLPGDPIGDPRSEEHTSELQSRRDLVCRLLLEKKKKNKK